MENGKLNGKNKENYLSSDLFDVINLSCGKANGRVEINQNCSSNYLFPGKFDCFYIFAIQSLFSAT